MDSFRHVREFPLIQTLADFGKADPAACTSLAMWPNIKINEKHSFLYFVNHRLPSLKLLEISDRGEIVGLSPTGKMLFMSIGLILATFYQNGEFAGDLMGRIQISEDLKTSFPYPPKKFSKKIPAATACKFDVMHIRRMLAMIIMKSHPTATLSKGILLFFSEIFIQDPQEYFILQVLHPIFYGTVERDNFLHLVLNYKKDTYCDDFFVCFTYPIYGYKDWWTKIAPGSILYRVLHFEGKFKHNYEKRPYSLPKFIRNSAHHYHDKNNRPTLVVRKSF